MVLASEEEVSWTSDLCAAAEGDCGEIPACGHVKDRSVSYLDLQGQFFAGENKVFESLRKFGRPRQQISDFVDFVDLNRKVKRCDRYHFGQCLILPKVSTLPPKGKKHRGEKRFGKSERRSERFEGMPRSGAPYEDRYEFENRMYRWSEHLPEPQSKRCSRKSSVTGSRRELDEFYNDDFEDVEAQVNKYRRDAMRSPESRDDCQNSYRQSTLESRRKRPTDFNEGTNAESRMSGARDNWRLRVTKENEFKRETAERMADDVWEARETVRANWTAVTERVQRELHRSKSTPDVWGEGRKKLQVWSVEGGQVDVPRRNGSLMNVCTRNWTVYNDQQEADSLNAPQSLHEPVPSPEILPGPGKPRRFPSGKNFFGHFLTPRGATPTEMFSNTEPFSQFWVTLSNIYGQALIIIMLVFTLTEVMDNSVKLLSLQGIYLMYLYVGSIAVIICIYIWVLIDSCSSIQNDSTGLMSRTISAGVVHDREPENMATTKFGSLKKAHISRDRTSNTSFYLRIGAIAFGLGTLVFNGLEMAMHSMMESSCLNDVVFVHPILHGLFTFLQMHFLFVNSQVLVERFGLAARFGFMHLAATNLALWIRLAIWESGNEWTHYLYLSHESGRTSDIPSPLSLRGFPKFITRRERDLDTYNTVSNQHMRQVVALHHCLNTNSLGQLWTSSMPFLYPFIIQFSIIAAAVTYIMGQNVAKDHLFFQKQKKIGNGKTCTLGTLRSGGMNTWGVDCGGASKGLFLGILCLVTGVVVIIIFLVVKENEDFPPETIFWLTTGTLITILSITIVMNVVGLIQIRKLSVIGTKMPPLDKILAVASILGVQLYTISGIVVGAAGVAKESDQEFATPTQKRHAMLLAVSLIQLVQAIMQSCFVVEGIRRTSLSRTQILTKPARQVVTFFMFSNAVLWAFDTFVIQSWMTQELQLRFFGVLAWGVISRVSLPLFIFFRFHSCVLLLEIWKKSYQSIHLDPGN